MPNWGQLGCNGFIILDANLNVVQTKTSAFLEVREEAFQEVETILARVLPPPPMNIPAISAVQSMSVKALKSVITSLSGIFSDCIEKADLRQRALKLIGEAQAKASRDKPTTKKRKAQGGPAVCKPCPPATKPTDNGVAPLGAIKSVKVKELDAEHDQCAAALAAMVQRKDYQSLLAVIRAYETHFKHEEQLLDKHLYAGVAIGGNGFNADAGARRSHFTDHTRLLAELYEAKCASKRGVPLSKKFLERTLRNFEAHANQYDNAYAARLSAAIQ